MTTRPVERRHREAALPLMHQGQLERLRKFDADRLEQWLNGERGAPIDCFADEVSLESVAELLANAEHPAPSAPAEFDPGESPSFGLETWRGPLGLVRLVLRGREHVGYRALGPMQQMPREDFERVFTKCVSPTIEELKVKGPVPAESPQPKAQGDGWVSVEERMPEVDAMYLCWRPDYLPHVLPFTDGRWGKTIHWDHCEPTHWRPLPTPPEVP